MKVGDLLKNTHTHTKNLSLDMGLILKNSTVRGAWQATFCGVTKSRTQLSNCWASRVALIVKNLPAMQENHVQSLGWEDPPEKEMAYPLQYSRLENPMDRGVWRTTVHGVRKIWTQLSN